MLNETCEYCIEVSELEFKDNSQYYKKCLLCNSLLRVTKESLDEIVKKDIETQVKENVDKWVKQYSWDYVIDLVKKYKDYYAVGRLYITELEKRGFKIK